MSWNTPDSYRITHASGHVVGTDYGPGGIHRSQHRARVSLIFRLKGKLWAAPGGPKDIPTGDVQACDFSDHEQAYWSTGASLDAIDKRMESELGARIEAAMSRRRAAAEQRIFLPTPTENRG